jgi:hypothetical protein
MMDMDNWKDGTYPDDGEARKYANVAVDIIDAWCASQKASTKDSALPISDVVNWLPFNEENASHYTRLAKEGKLIQLYDNGEEKRADDEDLPFAIVTHYREG